jgi:hypothetical protein
MRSAPGRVCMEARAGSPFLGTPSEQKSGQLKALLNELDYTNRAVASLTARR